MLASKLIDGILDRFGLGNAQRHDPKRQVRMLCGVVEDSLSDEAGLCGVVAPAAPAVGAVNDEQLDAKVGPDGIGPGVGDELPFVELVVAEGDQFLMATAVVPLERDGTEQLGALAQPEDRLEVVELVLLIDVIVVHGGVEEGGRWELSVVTGDDQLLSPVDAVDRICRRDL